MVLIIIIFGGWGLYMVCEEPDGGDGLPCTYTEGMWKAWEYLNDPAVRFHQPMLFVVLMVVGRLMRATTLEP